MQDGTRIGMGWDSEGQHPMCWGRPFCFSDTPEPPARQNEPGSAAQVLVHVSLEKYLFSTTCPK